MARPREFDKDDALTRAMDVFWKHGYANASLPMLLEGMGITRGSLYKAFSDKRALFLAALDRYEAVAVAPAVRLLGDQTIPDGLDRVERLFRLTVAAARDGDTRGCLLCSAAAATPVTDDPEIAAAVGLLMDKMHRGFASALDGPPETRQARAALLMTQYLGLRMLARSDTPAERLAESVDQIMTLLRGAEARPAH